MSSLGAGRLGPKPSAPQTPQTGDQVRDQMRDRVTRLRAEKSRLFRAGVGLRTALDQTRIREELRQRMSTRTDVAAGRTSASAGGQTRDGQAKDGRAGAVADRVPEGRP